MPGWFDEHAEPEETYTPRSSDRVQAALDRIGRYHVVREQGRIFVECPEDSDYDETVEALQIVLE